MIVLRIDGDTADLHVGDFECRCLIPKTERGEYSLSVMEIGGEDVWGIHNRWFFHTGHSLTDVKSGPIVGDEIVTYNDRYFIRNSRNVLDQLNEVLFTRNVWEMKIV